MSLHPLGKHFFPFKPAFPFQNNNIKKIFIAGILLFELDHSAKYIKGSARVHSATTGPRK